MRVLIQCVSRASVSVDGAVVSSIGRGLVLFVGVGAGDSPGDAAALAAKCAHLRIMQDEAGKMNRSALEVGAHVLAISQFTLYADTSKGRRPSFVHAASPEQGQALYETFVGHLKEVGLRVGTGVFGAHMHVEIHNDGPVTILLESPRPGAQG